MLRLAQHGKKSGRGIFVWGPGDKGRPKSLGLNPAAPTATVTSTLPPEEAVDRLVLAMLNEAARALEEQVVAGPRELDLATVFGMGFAPFRGGLLRYADARGIAECVDALRRIAASPGVAGRSAGRLRFDPAPLLVAMARDGRRFHG
jgi:3-hydroxyacyl-CoA dehydrogenase/enoyl-CoA hydratase/3-hydroxybutyryl-CoA epimerase